MSEEPFDLERTAAVAARLDLREPNAAALESIAAAVGSHFKVEGGKAPFRGVVDVATGVGKTYILAAAIEYYAMEGVRNFAVITPGRTILDKTVANFTAGTPKSLVGSMEAKPVVITSENFASPAMRAAMDDETQVKLYVFTVQSLTKPSTKQGKKTHEFNEGLGEAFYEALQSADDLMVFADEHHAYFGAKFAAAVDDLDPHVSLGLTATPHPKTKDQIIYRYPLAAAIADRLVKTPVLVGRMDDLSDPTTKLLDGTALLSMKEHAVAAYCSANSATPVQPLMLVVAANISEANEFEEILTSPEFADGAFVDKVLTVHSTAPDEALAQLGTLEDEGSPYRAVISVGMLKEGWDNRAVFIICSMRASISSILTEQTLGRGLRLPFGSYTGIEVLDTLEVLGHERYEDLLKKTGILKQNFIDRRTRAVVKANADGQLVAVIEATETPTEVSVEVGSASSHGAAGQPIITSLQEHSMNVQQQVNALQEELAPRPGLPAVKIPVVRMGSPKSTFLLADIIDTDPFEKAGKSIAANPEDELRRTTISAKIVTGPDGLRHTELVTASAQDPVKSAGSLIPLEATREALLDRVEKAWVVQSRSGERAAAVPLVEAFIDGLGADAGKLLSAFTDRAAAKLITLITTEHSKFKSKVSFQRVVEMTEHSKVRLAKAKTTDDLAGKYQRGVGYRHKKSLYTQDWFDSGTERDLANIIDGAPAVAHWLRLQTGDLPIVWAEDRSYHPDFVVVETSGDHCIVEVKMQKEMSSADVLGKREAAKRWVNHVNKSAKVKAVWAYLLLGEDDVKMASGSWPALKKLAS